MSGELASPSPSAGVAWIPIVTVILGILGTVGMILGAVLTIGAWRAEVDAHFASLDKRMDQAEANQKTYIPVLLGLTKDVSYLADRARREDDRLVAEHAR